MLKMVLLVLSITSATEGLQLHDLLQQAGARSLAASSGEFQTTVAGYVYPGTTEESNYNSAHNDFESALNSIAKTAQPGMPPDDMEQVFGKFDAEHWLPLYRRSESIVYREDLFRYSQSISRESLDYTIRTQAGSPMDWKIQRFSPIERRNIVIDDIPTEVAFDGSFQYSVMGKELRVTHPGSLSAQYRISALDMSMYRRDQIPEESYVRKDQELIYKQLDDDTYLYRAYASKFPVNVEGIRGRVQQRSACP